MTRYEELVKQRQTLSEQILEAAKELFQEESKHLFEQHPALVSFGWEQYTPYFNDGDPCVFRAATDEPYIKTVDDEDEFFYPPWDRDPETDLEKAGVAVKDFLSTFADTELQRLFGDHISVTVFKDKVEIEDCDHD